MRKIKEAFMAGSLGSMLAAGAACAEGDPTAATILSGITGAVSIPSVTTSVQTLLIAAALVPLCFAAFRLYKKVINRLG